MVAPCALKRMRSTVSVEVSHISAWKPAALTEVGAVDNESGWSPPPPQSPSAAIDVLKSAMRVTTKLLSCTYAAFSALAVGGSPRLEARKLSTRLQKERAVTEPPGSTTRSAHATGPMSVASTL